MSNTEVSHGETSTAITDEVDRPVVALKLKVSNHQRTVGVAARVPRQRKGLEDKVSCTFCGCSSVVSNAPYCCDIFKKDTLGGKDSEWHFKFKTWKLKTRFMKFTTEKRQKTPKSYQRLVLLPLKS